MSSRSGWVKAHRSFLDWEWFRKGHCFKVMMALVFKANYKDRAHRGTKIPRGSLIIGRELFASELGISISQLRTSLSHLQSTGEVTIKSSRKGTVIQVVKYDDYQALTNDLASELTSNLTSKLTTLERKEEERSNMSDDVPPPANGVGDLFEEVDTPPAPEPEVDPEEEFLEALWNASPGKSRNRSSKKEVKQEWRKIPKKDRPPFETVMESLLDWVRCPDWTKEGGKYATGLHRWIKACKWESSPDHTPEETPQSFADQRADASNPHSPNYTPAC